MLTALIPLLVAIWLSDRAVRAAVGRFYRPELGQRLDQALELYQELARSVKASMRYEAQAIAANVTLRRAAEAGDAAALKRELERLLQQYPNLVSLSVEDAKGQRLATVNRGRPFDPAKENKLEISQPLAEGAPVREQVAAARPSKDEDDEEDAPDEEAPAGPAVPRLVAVFAADKARFDELTEMSQFVDTYQRIDRDRETQESAYVYVVAALLGLTILGAIGVGVLFARGVSSRIAELGEATRRVAGGDLSVRVPEDGGDEIADLARAFNRMLNEVESSRARIEYLQRIGAWQEMARRLAHEIKNPLTPIQLAVQEIHRRYSGSDSDYRKLVDSTLEIVEDEVGTLRRLVTEFSDFARLPQAELKEADLVEFVREQEKRLLPIDDSETEAMFESGSHGADVQIELNLVPSRAPAYLDRQMLRRALINLVRNAAQAIEAAGRKQGKVRLSLQRDADFWLLDIEDDGPGIPDDMRLVVFDPYVTTKTDGTGLGLAIVKKIVVEHGGAISADKSALGGARMRIRLPVAGTSAGAAALEARSFEPPASRRTVPSIA